MPVGIPHLGVGERHQVALPVEGAHLDHALAGLDAIGAGVHPQGAADGARYAMVEMEAADAGLQRHGGQPLVGRSGAGADGGGRGLLDLAEALGRQADHEAADAAFADQQVGADADHGERHVDRHGAQEGGEVLLVGRLEQRLGGAAGAEPGDLLHLRIGRDAAAQAGQPVAEAGQEGVAPHAASPPSSLGSW